MYRLILCLQLVSAAPKWQKKSLHANLTAAVILGFHSVLDSKCLGDYKHLGLNAPHVSIDLHMLRVVGEVHHIVLPWNGAF